LTDLQWLGVGLASTTLLLVLVLVTGFRAKRKPHLVFVTLTVAALVFTIFRAEQLGTGYDLEQAGVITPIHLLIAKVTTLAYLLPVITGYQTWRNPAKKPLHRKAVFLVLFLTLTAFVTGTMMMMGAVPLDPAAQEAPAVD